MLADNVFVYDLDDVYCVWQNEFNPEDKGVDISLNIIAAAEDGLYAVSYTHLHRSHRQKLLFPERFYRPKRQNREAAHERRGCRTAEYAAKWRYTGSLGSDYRSRRLSLCAD